jgi:two-component system chemotaxis response regulator CheY
MAKILVVEDCCIMRELIGLQLAAAGYSVDEAEDGLSGLEAVRRSRPDVIVSNVDMPVLDGFQFFGALQADRSARTIPVIFVSAQTRRRPRAEELGAAAFVTKPVILKKLLGLVFEYARP